MTPPLSTKTNHLTIGDGGGVLGIIKETTYWSTANISVGINAVLIDVEMVFFALMHLKAFSYKPYVPLVPNPDLPEEKDQDSDQEDDGSDSDISRGKPHNARNQPPRQQNRGHTIDRNQSLDSMRSDQAGGDNSNEYSSSGDGAGVNNNNNKNDRRFQGTRGASSNKHQKGKQQKRQKQKAQRTPPGADVSFRSKSRRRDSDDDDYDRDLEEAPEFVMDYKQKTPIWKGLVDSFNPLDTIRELGYGVKYLYRWARGVPVDKDSRRLLDLEHVFGRQRPEVPYDPSKEKKQKKKTKKKKRGDASDDSDEDSDEDDDEKDDHDQDDYDDDKDDRRDYGGRGKSKKNEKDREKNVDDDVQRGGQDTVRGKGKHERDRSVNQKSVSRYREFDDQSFASLGYGVRGSSSRRPIDALYDMSHKPSGDSIGGPSGSKSVPRKPVKTLGNVKSEAKAGYRQQQQQQQQQQQSKKGSVRYLGKEEAARTERATLPDIQPEPVERKVALSGLYIDPSLPPVELLDSRSSMDIPLPMNYHSRHPSYELHHARDRSWRQRIQEDLLRERSSREPMPFIYRDRGLERDAIPYVVPAPVVPITVRPNVSDTREPTQLANRDFVVVQGDLYQGDRPVDRVDLPVATDRDVVESSAEIANARIATLYRQHYPSGHGRAESVDDSLLSGSVAGGFYHLREGSYSDPELSTYGPDYEHYDKQPRYQVERDRSRHYQPTERQHQQQQQQQPTERQHQQQQQQQQRMPEPHTESTAPQKPVPVVDERAQPEPEQPVQSPGDDPNVDVDPIVAHYKQLQQRQKLEEQQQQQQEEQEQEERRQREQLQQQQQQQQRQQQQQQLQHQSSLQRRYALPRRRNSLESLDSDSSGGFRMRAVGSYERNNYGYATLRPRPSRYQRAYRYQAPLPRPASPARFYRFPEDREIYEQRKREQQQRQEQQQQQQLQQQQPTRQQQQPTRQQPPMRQQQQQPPLQSQPQSQPPPPQSQSQSQSQQPRQQRQPHQQRYQQRQQQEQDLGPQQPQPHKPTQRSPLVAQWRDWEHEQQQYYRAPSLPRPLPAQEPEPWYPEPSYQQSYYDGYSRFSQYPEPSYSGYEPRYRSPPPPADLHARSARPMIYGPPAPLNRPIRNFGGDYRGMAESSARTSMVVPMMGPGAGPGADAILPVSRYAAPILRDHELQQREGRRRMSNVNRGPMGP